MGWVQQMLGLERDGPRHDTRVSFSPTVHPSRLELDNLTTNRVSLQDVTDSLLSTDRAAMGLSATWACVNLLAGTIASLPLMVYRTDANGERTVARNHPLYRLLHRSPNADQTSFEFWEFITSCLELKGDGFAPIERGRDGRIIALGVPLAPDTVRVKRERGALTYETEVAGRLVTRHQEGVLHIRGFGGDPLGGMSTLAWGAKVFGLAAVVNSSAAEMFRNGIRPSGILYTKPDETLTAEQRADLEVKLGARFQGTRNTGNPMVLDRGLKWESISLNPEDAQMLQSRSFSIEEVCRMFGVPPFMVGHTEKSTSWGTGLEQQMRMFYVLALRKRLTRIEQALEKQLLTPADKTAGITIEFNVEGLLRGDSKSRAEFYASGLQNGWRTINEVRALENLPPVAGGDVPRMQSQNIPITQATGLQGAANE